MVHSSSFCTSAEDVIFVSGRYFLWVENSRLAVFFFQYFRDIAPHLLTCFTSRETSAVLICVPVYCTWLLSFFKF